MKRIRFKHFDICLSNNWGNKENIKWFDFYSDIKGYGVISITLINFEIELQF